MAGMSDADVQGQIAHMIAFIDQEASEKVEEIDLKAEEEFNIEKGRLVQQARVKIMDFYDRKEKQVELQKKIQNSNMQNNSRLQILRRKQELVKELLEKARKDLSTIPIKDPARYKDMLKTLILQGLVRMMEAKVTVRGRSEDAKIIKAFFPEITAAYKDLFKGQYQVQLTLDEDNFLGADISGGVWLLAMGGKITVVNTLDERLDLVSEMMMPLVRETLFGVNPNRRFKE